jgi:acetylserotonin N-methyltransferase
LKVPDPALVLDLIEAFRRSKTMFAGVELRLFDRLESSSATAAALAADLHTQAEPLERLLDGCVSLGLLSKRDGCYTNEPVAGLYLRQDSPHTLAGYILYSNRMLFPLWSHLEDAIREGSPRWKQTFGADGGIFDHFFQTEDSMRTFLEGMHGLGLLSSPGVIEAFDLSNFHRLIDLGGATGHLAVAACDRYPNLQAIVFDLPRVIDIVSADIRGSGAASRIEWVAGDFFRDELPPADLFAISRILHDWSDEKIQVLLKKIFRRLPVGGALLVAEKLINEEKTGPTSAQMQSLNMLVCTEGKERTLSEYRELLETAGFQNVQGKLTGSPLDALLAFRTAA